MNAAERACNALEKDMMQRIATEYDEAALRSIRNLDAFFADMEALDHKKPPSVYRTQAQQERWRQREMRKLLEKHKAESMVSRQLEEAGDAIATLIVLYKIGLLSETGNGTAREINRQQKSFPAMERIRIPVPFPKATPPDLVHAKTSHQFTQQEREIEIILRDTQTPFSKVSIKNLKAAPALRRRLRNEMAQAVLKGESQQQLAKRIERVMQSGAYNARRIAQTERTRVQSQAAWDVMVQSEQLGVNMAKKWRAKMVNTRDSHAALNGAIAPLHKPFHTIWGNSLMYPGDPSAPANEVINCHCGISPVVLRPGEVLQNRSQNDRIEGKRGGSLKITKPIEQRNTGKGNPNAIIQFGRPLSARQEKLLKQLPAFDSKTSVPKGDVSMKDLAALTANTGCEFSMFTKSGERLIIRGNETMVNIDEKSANELACKGYRWSGHTHPGIDRLSTTASDGDYAILAAFSQLRSVVYNSSGRYQVFEGGVQK